MRKVMLLLVLVSWPGVLWAADPIIGTGKLRRNWKLLHGTSCHPGNTYQSGTRCHQ